MIKNLVIGEKKHAVASEKEYPALIANRKKKTRLFRKGDIVEDRTTGLMMVVTDEENSSGEVKGFMMSEQKNISEKPCKCGKRMEYVGQKGEVTSDDGGYTEIWSVFPQWECNSCKHIEKGDRINSINRRI